MPRDRRRSATMADIAKVSGVSITTVSHVINKTRAVRQETESAVISAIAAVGYRHQNHSNATGTKMLGLASSAISNPSFHDLLRGVEQAASRVGYSLLVADTHDELAVELRVMTELVSRQVEAILIAPAPGESTAVDYAVGEGVPVVVMDRSIDADVDQIGAENIESTASLVEHLASIGHTKIAMISGLPGLSTTRERIAGFKLGATRHDLSLGKDRIVSGLGDDDAAEQVMLQLMGSADPPTALVMGNNRTTIGAMRAARRLGIEIPRDVALVAFDDFEWADLFHPRLTVIAQPTASIGEQAVELIMSRLDEPERISRRLTLTPSFIHRDSCGCQS